MRATRHLLLWLSGTALAVPLLTATTRTESASSTHETSEPLARTAETIAALGHQAAASDIMHARRSVLTPDAYALRFSFSLDDTRPRSASIETTLRAIDVAAWQIADSTAFRGWGTINAHTFRSASTAGGSLLPEAVSLRSVTELPAVADAWSASLPATFAAAEYSVAGDATTSAGAIAALGFYKTFSSSEPPARALLTEGPPAAIPEPSTVVLLAAGSLVIFLRARRSRSGPSA